MVAFSLAIWMSRGLAAGCPGVGVASVTMTTCYVKSWRPHFGKATLPSG
jgi:hypothetical protein